jgi:integrase/recombinase XerD
MRVAREGAMSSRLVNRFDQFIQHGVYLRNWQATTVRTYRQGLASLAIEQPTKADLDEWVIRLRERGLTPGGVNMYIRSVNSYLHWLAEEGHSPQRLKVKILRAPLRQHTLLTAADVRAILRFQPKTKGDHRTRALILLLLDTGVRITEALTLERDRVRLDDMLLTVMGKGAKERTVPFSLELRPILYRWMQRSAASQFVFSTTTGTRLTYRNAFREIRTLCARAGVRVACHPHLFRHQYAANFIKQGGDVYRLSRLLGHTAITTTQTYLRSLGVEELRSGRERLTPLAI